MSRPTILQVDFKEKSNRLHRALSPFLHSFLNIYPPFSVSLIVSSLPLVALLYQHLLAVFLFCPSLAFPGACLGGSVPVCLFADDSTWSRCDAQQLLVCFAALPSNDSHAPIYLNTFFSPSTAPLNHKLASLILFSDVFLSSDQPHQFILLSSLPAAAVNVQSIIQICCRNNKPEICVFVCRINANCCHTVIV